MLLRARLVGHALFLALIAFPLGSCEEGGAQRDGRVGDGGTPTGTCPAGVDPSVDISSAMELKAGQDAKHYICPTKDADFFKITIPKGDTLLRISLRYSAPVGNMRLTYLVLDGKKKTVATAPAGDGKRYDALHCLPPGTYYILVQDQGNDNKDAINAYTLRYTTEKDPDPNEKNNTAATATALSGAVTGTISCTEDVDFFKVTASELLEIKLTTTKATPVDIWYEVYDSKNKIIAENGIVEGSKKAANLTTVHALPASGTYTIKVHDKGGDDSDPKTSYTLTATPRAEKDAQDKGRRNDSPATATVVGNFTGGTLSKTYTGQIGSQADQDYFVIHGLANVNANNPAVIEVSVNFGGASKVDPAIGLIYGDPQSPCKKDNCCRVLNPAGAGCINMLNCVRQTYSCITKGDNFCTDNECAPNAGSGCTTERRCAGAAVCLPNKVCGAEQVVRYDTSGDDGASIRTAQPLLHPGPWYVRITDLKSDEYDYGKNYTLTIKVRMDPDGNKELNNEYFPILVSTSLKKTVRSMHAKAAKAKPAKVTLTKPGDAVTISGFISYEGDQDWIVVDHPCPGGECVLEASFKAGSGCPKGTANTGLEFVYILHEKDGKPKDSFPPKPTSGQSGTFGRSNGNCFLARRSGSYLLSISDLGHNAWSWSCGYSITLKYDQTGCPSPCKTYQGKCYVP